MQQHFDQVEDIFVETKGVPPQFFSSKKWSSVWEATRKDQFVRK